MAACDAADALHDPRSWVRNSSSALCSGQAGTFWLTVCNLTNLDRSCSGCKVIPDVSFPCAVTCVAAEDCSKINPNYDDMCRLCYVAGCQRCLPKDARKCGACLPGFSLSPLQDHCGLTSVDFLFFDEKMFWPILAGLVVLALLALTLIWVADRHYRSRNAEYGALVRHALDHHKRCLVQNPASLYDGRNRIPLLRALTLSVFKHHPNQLGMSLYGQALVFVAIWGFALWVSDVLTLLVPVADAPDRRGHSDVSVAGWCEGAIDLMRKWESRASSDDAEIAWALGRLYVGFLAGLLWLARLQWVTADLHGRLHAKMSDFAVLLEGLPHEATEEEVTDFLEALLERPIVGVSIAYDFSSKAHEIRRLLDALLLEQEPMGGGAVDDSRDLGGRRDGGAASSSCGPSSTGDPSNTGDPSSTDSPRGRRGSIFSRGSGSSGPQDIPKLLRELQGSGTAIAVTETAADAARLDVQISICKPMFPGTNGMRRVVSSRIFCEPPEIFWEGFRKPPPQDDSLDASLQIRRRLRRRYVAMAFHFVAITCFMLLFGSIFYVPAYWYANEIIERTGHQPSSLVWTIIGLLVASGNGLMNQMVWLAVQRVSFRQKSQRDVMILSLYLALALTNISVNVFVVFRSVDQFRVNDVAASRYFAGVAKGRLITALTASSLFSYFVWPLFYLWHPFMSRVCLFVKYLRRGNRLKEAAVKRALEPPPMYVEYDHAELVIFPSVGLVSLFFRGTQQKYVFLSIGLWYTFRYFSARIINFRHSYLTYYSSSRLGLWTLRFFTVPLAIHAGLVFYWGAGSVLDAEVIVQWQAWLVIPGAVLSTALYLPLLQLSMRRGSSLVPSSEHDEAWHPAEGDALKGWVTAQWAGCFSKCLRRRVRISFMDNGIAVWNGTSATWSVEEGHCLKVERTHNGGNTQVLHLNCRMCRGDVMGEVTSGKARRHLDFVGQPLRASRTAFEGGKVRLDEAKRARTVHVTNHKLAFHFGSMKFESERSVEEEARQAPAREPWTPASKAIIAQLSSSSDPRVRKEASVRAPRLTHGNSTNALGQQKHSVTGTGESYRDLEQRSPFPFNWFNVNPIWCLKARYLGGKQALPSVRVCFWSPGVQSPGAGYGVPGCTHLSKDESDQSSGVGSMESEETTESGIAAISISAWNAHFNGPIYI
mmetsp:Transcript_67239/g.186265  ORF Transcript_67239/g.186265 Transcript_67239/m.186265 type:complete len:1162 (+) Transcript_67239:61-3546(+)